MKQELYQNSLFFYLQQHKCYKTEIKTFDGFHSV